jgi:hypothetical protein
MSSVSLPSTASRAQALSRAVILDWLARSFSSATMVE